MTRLPTPHLFLALAIVACGGDEAAAAERECELEKLHAKNGQLVVERDFLAKASGR